MKKALELKKKRVKLFILIVLQPENAHDFYGNLFGFKKANRKPK